MMISQNSHYTYRPHPYQGGSFQIFLMRGLEQEVVGEYLLLDQGEDYDLTEKTVMNLVSLLNGRDDLIYLGNQTDTRLYFQRLEDERDGRGRVLFRSYRGEGVSDENALLSYNKEKVDV